MQGNDSKCQSLPVEAFFAVVNGEIFVWEALEKALRDAGVPITVGRLIPLHHLIDGPLRLQELTERMRAKPSAASRLIERMVGDGLIEKCRDESDGRAVLLRVTDKGRRAEIDARTVFSRCVGEVFADLDESELRDLRDLLARVQAPAAEAVA